MVSQLTLLYFLCALYRVYQNAILEKAADSNCTHHPDVRAYIMPLRVPHNAGLRYWKTDTEYVDVDYEMGKLYSFDASTVHAIRPIPYFEWRRNELRIILQAFAVTCDDGRTVLFH